MTTYHDVLRELGERDADLADGARRIILFLDRELKPSPPRNILEIGVGCGAVLLALAWTGAQRVGTDISPAWVDEALRNSQRCEDHALNIFQSDLFSNVRGVFDLILFNPWQPSERSLSTILAFVESAPGHLAPRGTIFLAVTDHPDGPVLPGIQQTMRQAGLKATRHVVRAWRSSPHRVEHLSYLLLRHSTSESGRIELVYNRELLGYFARAWWTFARRLLGTVRLR